MATRFPLFLSLFFCSLGLVCAEPTGGYEFTINGKPENPCMFTTEGEAPVSGDVIFVTDIPLCLDGPGRYRFESREGVVRRLGAKGKPVVVACRVGSKRDAEGLDTKELLNPLETMDDTGLKALRGVTLEAWPEGIEKLLARLDLARVCIELKSPVLANQPGGLPPLPGETRFLVINSGGSWDCEDLSGLRRLKQLRFLGLDTASPRRFDFRVLEGLPLEYLSMPRAEQPEHLEALGSLTGLKCLDANWCSYLGDGRWLSKLANLRRLDARYIRSKTPLDLSAIADLSRLVSFDVSGSLVQTLPARPIPSLQKATLLLCGVPQETLDAFLKVNPQAAVGRDMNAELSKQLAKADRLKIRSGGTCHRQPAAEKVIFETRDREAIRKVAGHFGIDEARSGGSCMCCGDPTFEFYEGNRCVAMIGFHHGMALRWADGNWPGDGALTVPNADFLARLVTDHGYGGPLQELTEERRREAARARRFARYQALMPKGMARALESCQSLDEARAVVEKAVPDAKERAALYLRLYGCDEGSWSLAAGIDGALEEGLFSSLSKEVFHEAMAAAGEGSREARGAVRWVFGRGHADEWKADPKALERFARMGLEHPRRENRWRTLAGLRELKTPWALGLLREVMQQGTHPRKLDPAEADEPGGMKTFYPGAIPLPEQTPDAAAAALCLAMMGDQESAAEVKRIRDGLPKEARQKWDECLKPR